MKNYKLVIGIDISKLKLDITFVVNPEEKKQDHLVVSNNNIGIKLLLKEIKKREKDLNNTLVCFENTGVYGMPLSLFFSKHNIDFWMVPPIEIKRSKGITRGKSDKADSMDIAFYAITHRHSLELTKLAEKDIIKLQLIYNQREKILKAIHSLSMTDENKGFLPKEIINEIIKINDKSIEKLKEALTMLEAKIKEIIEANVLMKKQVELMKSVPGVGEQMATLMIITTRCFTSFKEWRKMACYAGVAPFEYSSGKSIKGKTKVNSLANKKIKTILHLCALTAKRCDTELQNYYNKKVEEGKNKMSVINAVRCKVLSRIFATVNRGTPFVNTAKFAS